MTLNERDTPKPEPGSWLRTLGKILGSVLAVLILVIVASVLVFQRVADGPIGPLAGGPLVSGPLIAQPIEDWSFVDGAEIELQLVEPAGSRTTGSLVYKGQLYVPCDLGFVWRRLPGARARAILSVVYAVKHWHQDALRDGRVVLRIAGNRYERQAVRVTDPKLLETLRSIIETEAGRYFSVDLAGIPADSDAIWFFRMDPRSDVSP